MSRRIEIVLKPAQAELQDAINEKLRDVQHLPDRNGGTDIILSVPANSDLTFLDELGVQYSIKIKYGRTPQGKATVHYTVDWDVAEYIKRIPDGERSQFVNSILREGIEKRQNGFSKSLESQEQT